MRLLDRLDLIDDDLLEDLLEFLVGIRVLRPPPPSGGSDPPAAGSDPGLARDLEDTPRS
jgi:hypothetical protein